MVSNGKSTQPLAGWFFLIHLSPLTTRSQWTMDYRMDPLINPKPIINGEIIGYFYGINHINHFYGGNKLVKTAVFDPSPFHPWGEIMGFHGDCLRSSKPC